MDSQRTTEGLTAGQLIDELAGQFAEAGLHFGHGTANPRDEAAALVFHVAGLDHQLAASEYRRALSAGQLAEIRRLAAERTASRKPLAYLLHESWFAGYPFYVDERVLVPRSPLAELIEQRFQPWVGAEVRSVLEIGTGSGCIAIATALWLPDVTVQATDISAAALAVARQNAASHGVETRVEFIETDLLDGIAGAFDVIISNPPYVPEAERERLPPEYGHEPGLGLYSGPDGLDSARRILQDAPKLLTRQGILILEVGAQWAALEQAFPELPFTWLEFEYGGEGVALLHASDFPAN